MKIHRVKEGDSVFSIAREYAVPPTKIIESNTLSNPDNLSVGQQLLILTPTRTHTVRGSDTLKGIAERFSIRTSDLIAKNPSLHGENSIYPGQILTIKSDTPPYGIAFAHGYIYKGTSLERLKSFLPYLTYVSVSAGKILRDDVKLLFDDSKVVEAVRASGKIPLLHLHSESGAARLDEAVIDTAILLAKARGYDGLTLTVNNINDYEEYSKFLLELKKTLMEYDLILFVDIDKNSSARIKESYDGILLSFSKAQSKNPESFDSCERKIFTDFANESESSKAYIELSPFAFANNEAITVDEALKLAYSGRCEILYDEDTKLCQFDCNRYSFGRKNPTRVVFESLENVKAKLDLVCELGYMGISIDIQRCPMSYALMFDCLFRQSHCITPLY